MQAKHPFYYILPGAVIALMLIQFFHEIGSGNNARQFWIFLIAMLGISIFGLAVLLFRYSSKLKSKSL